jgi:IS5 family transposase
MMQNTLLKLAAAIRLPVPENRHRTGPKKFPLQSLAYAILFRSMLGIRSDRELVRKLKNWKELRNACGLKSVPSNSTFSRAREKLNFAELFYWLVSKAKELGMAKGIILSIDSTQFKAYLKGDKEARVGYCAAKDEYIFGYKAHIVTDAVSELPVAVVLTPASTHDSKEFLPLMRRVWKNFTYEIRKLLADSGYDSSAIRKFLRDCGIEDIIDRNKRRGKEFPKPKDPDYRKRVSSERVNSHAKENFGLESFTFAGIRRALQHAYACLSAMLFSAIGSFQLGIVDWRRLLV